MSMCDVEVTFVHHKKVVVHVDVRCGGDILCTVKRLSSVVADIVIDAQM